MTAIKGTLNFDVENLLALVRKERALAADKAATIPPPTSITVNPLYYHQYLQTLSYSVVGGGSPTAPTATGTALGVAYAPSLTTTATPYWFDASGSVTFST
ncbi:MAG: hypothetical protein ABSE74_02155, partial [Methanoregula sp.]